MSPHLYLRHQRRTWRQTDVRLVFFHVRHDFFHHSELSIGGGGRKNSALLFHHCVTASTRWGRCCAPPFECIRGLLQRCEVYHVWTFARGHHQRGHHQRGRHQRSLGLDHRQQYRHRTRRTAA